MLAQLARTRMRAKIPLLEEAPRHHDERADGLMDIALIRSTYREFAALCRRAA